MITEQFFKAILGLLMIMARQIKMGMMNTATLVNLAKIVLD